MQDPLGEFSDTIARWGNTVLFRWGSVRYYLFNDPEAIHHFCVGNAGNYHKGRSYTGLRTIFGNGLLTSEGKFWRRQRKLAQPAFQPRSLGRFAETMTRCTQELLDRWDRHDLEQPLDMHHEMYLLTLRVVGHTLFGAELSERAHTLSSIIEVLARFAFKQSNVMLPLPAWVPTPERMRCRKVLRVADGIVTKIIAERRQRLDKGADDANADLLGMLMAATDEVDNSQMTNKQLRDEVFTLLAAGNETTTTALTWTLILLSRHPDVARRLASEVEGVLGGRTPTLEDLPRLEYVERVLQESMRLYPPAWIIEREALADDEIAGFPIPRGALVTACMYTLHRNREIWDNPEGFDPDRFSAGRTGGRHRCAYMPFGAGPRSCVGAGFAMMETKLALAMIVQRYRVELRPGAKIELDPTVTLRPRGSVPMFLKRV